MNDLKTVLLIVGGSIVLVLLMIFGLTKMAGNSGNEVGVIVDENVLSDGALLSTQSGEVKVTVVNFSDMQCPACKAADGVLEGLVGKEGVRYVIRHYPLMGHRYSTNGARAVEAARQMGKGWEMMDLLFEKQEEWSGVSPKEIDARMIDYATDLGLEKTDFEERSKSDDTAQAVNTDKALGDRLRLSGTPTVYVNGEQVSPDFVLGRVDELIKAAGEK